MELLEKRVMLTSGLFGEYFAGASLEALRMTRDDVAVDFDFGSASPADPVPSDRFSVRWTGHLLPEFSEEYTFHVTADDGVRLWINDVLLVDRWVPVNQVDGDANRDGTVSLDDFNVLALHFGTAGATWEQGDFSGDGIVDLADFNRLANNFGHTAPPALPITDTATLALTASDMAAIRLEYFDWTGPASVSLKWSSPSQPLQVVPRDRMSNSVSPGTFTNPVVPANGSGADPWVTYYGGYYYHIHAQDTIGSTKVFVRKSARLQDIGLAEPVQIWQGVPGTSYATQVWAPELHRLDGQWYVYFTASNGSWTDHRNYVLEADTTDPQGTYTFKGKMAVPSADYHAIDGSVFEYGGDRFFLYSGWATAGGTTEQRVYMARLSDPLTLVGERVELSRPDQPWELTNVNEGPTAIISPEGKLHVTFSVNNYWMSEYSLAMVTFTGGDIMQSANWVKSSAPVFAQANGVAGVGHASFTISPDGTEDWIVYHSMQQTGLRDVRIQKFTWNPDGSPDFGQPVATGSPVVEPSGTPTFYSSSTRQLPFPHTHLEADDEADLVE